MTNIISIILPHDCKVREKTEAVILLHIRLNFINLSKTWPQNRKKIIMNYILLINNDGYFLHYGIIFITIKHILLKFLTIMQNQKISFLLL